MKKRIVWMIIAVLIFTATPFMSNEAQASGSATQDEIVNYAKQFIGVPYKWGGNTPSGFDCSGYTTYVFNQKFGFNLPRTSGSQAGVGSAVSKSNLQKGDLVFFSFTAGSSSVGHVGIYIGNGDFISATSSKGIAIEDLNTNSYWAPRYITARRVPGVTSGTTQVSNPAPAPKPAPRPDLPKGEYYDVSDKHWANQAITELSLDNIISGYEGSEFLPQKDVSRAEAAVMVAKALGLKPVSGSQFKDVPTSHWASGYINALAQKGIVSGRPEGFVPKGDISRGEITVILTRAFTMSATTSNVSFSDINNHWAKSSIMKVASAEVASGYNDGTFKPNASATRAEFAQFVYNSIK